MQYKLLQGHHVVRDPDTDEVITYDEGDTVVSDKDLCELFNKIGQPPRFELLVDANGKPL